MSEWPGRAIDYWIYIMKAIYSNILLVLGSLFVAVLFLFAIEMGAAKLLERKGEGSSPLVYDFEAESGVRMVGTTTRMSFLDPQLGYAHNPQKARDMGEVPGFAVYGSGPSLAPDAIRIVALGGSTTDPCEQGNWPSALQEVLAERGLETTVFNGGASGYSSNQELLKLIRDGLPLKPDLVISLNGVNDLGFLHSVKNHPMVHPYQDRLLRYFVSGGEAPRLFPNTRRLVKLLRRERDGGQRSIEGFTLGVRVSNGPWEQWRRNIGLMHAIAQESDTKYLCYLQPLMGMGKFIPTADEARMLEEYDARRHGTYLPKVTMFYERAVGMVPDISYCTNLVDVFEGRSNLYRDPRHPNPQGYRLIAEAIADDLEQRGLFPYLRSRAEQKDDNYLVSGVAQIFNWDMKNVEVHPVKEHSATNEHGNMLIFHGKGQLFHGDGVPVRAGERVTGKITAWAPDEGTEVTLLVARHCAPEHPFEGTGKRIVLGKTPQEYSVTHVFQEDQGCARIQIVSPQGRETRMCLTDAAMTRP